MRRFAHVVLASCVLVVVLLLAITTPALAQTKVRVGVFDSRAIAITYYQSPAFLPVGIQTGRDYAKAKADGNDKLLAEIEATGRLAQLQGFSIGSVSESLAKFTDGVAAVAKEAKVSAIVSQYELAYHGADIETVDVTEALVRKINDTPNARKLVDDLKKAKPQSMLEALGGKDKE